MVGAWIAAILGTCVYASPFSGPPVDAQRGLSQGPEPRKPGSDQLLALSDNEFVSFSPSEKSLAYSSDGGLNWVNSRSFVQDVLSHDPAGLQYVHGLNSVWVLDGDFFHRYEAGAERFEYPFNLADRMGQSYRISLHPAYADSAVICGEHMCTVGEFSFTKTHFADIYNATECVMDPYARAAAWCVMKESYSIPGALAYVNSNALRSKPGLQVAVAEIDDEPIESISTLFTTAEWTVAASKDRIAVKGPHRWVYANHPAFDSVSFQQGAANGVIAHAERSGSRYLWTMTSDGTGFVETEVKDASVVGVGQTLYTADVVDPQVSYNNGHSWQPASKELMDADLTTLLTSERLNVARTSGSSIVYSYDGAEWRKAQLPFENKYDEVSLVLVDAGSAVVCWARKSNQAFISQASDLSSWDPITLPLTDPQDDYAWAVSPESPKLVLKSKSETVNVDLTPYMGDGASCSASDLIRLDHEQCVLGSKVAVMGRKPDAKCVMGQLVENQFVVQRCACGTEDYSCGAQYVARGSQCVPDAVLQQTLDNCGPGVKQVAPRPFIPVLGTQCEGGKQYAANAFYDCDTSSVIDSEEVVGAAVAEDVVSVNKKVISGRMRDYLYLPGYMENAGEETVLVWNSEGDLHISLDQGTTWRELDGLTNVLNVFKSETDDNQVYVITESSMDDKTIWVSWDRGRNFDEIQLPATPNFVFSFVPNIVTFHPAHADWMLFSGMTDCDRFICPGVSFVSKDRGKTWTKMMDDTKHCQWVTGLALPTDENLVYCLDVNFEHMSTPLKLTWSTDYYKSGPRTIEGLESLVNVVVDGNYVILNHLNDFEEPEFKISRDGLIFEPAKYPANIKFSKKTAATVVTTRNKSIKMFQAVSSKPSKEFGILLKSDERGTDFITTLENINRASGGFFNEFIDYDTLQSVRGVAVANVVANPDDVFRRGVDKKIRTVITHSEGALWAPLEGPQGERLHLHGYTDRLDLRNEPSSPSAVGLMFGRGNEGDELMSLRSSKTYMTRDAGISWKKVSERPMFWEFGDSGSIVVLIDSMEPTNKIQFSLDEGESWQEYQFSEVSVKVYNLATIPSDSSRKFLIFGIPPVAYGDQTWAIQIDFSRLFPEQCEPKDFEWWTPSHPQLGTNCLLGEVVEYRRKKTDSKCYVGKNFDADGKPLGRLARVVETCKCTRQDYECDINYVQGADGSCSLLPDVPEPTKEIQCEKGAVAWHKVTGYRKVATSTCEGGEQLADLEEYACPGKEEEFERQRKGEKDVDDTKGGSSRGVFGRIWNFILYAIIGLVFILLLAGLVFAGYKAFTKYGHNVSLGGMGPSVRFPDAESSQQALHRSFDAAEGVLSHAVGLWRLFRSNIPYFGSQMPQDRLGFYSRMSDDERYRLLEEEGFEDDSDAQEDVFIDEDEAPSTAPFSDDLEGHVDSPFVDETPDSQTGSSHDAEPTETNAHNDNAHVDRNTE